MATCQRKKKRKARVFYAVQTACNEPAIITANHGKARPKFGQAWNVQNEMNERDVARDTLSELPNIPGLTRGEATWSWEVCGSGSLSVVPEVDAALRSCGLTPTALSKLSIPDMRFDTMPKRGDIIIGGTSSATGIVEIAPKTGERFLKVEITSGTFSDGEIISVSGTTLGDGGTTVGTLSGIATAGGFSYRLRSSGMENVTCRSEEDGRRKEIFNAMSTMSLSFEAGGIASIDFTTTGVVYHGARWIPVGSITGFADVSIGDEVSATGSKTGVLLRTPVAADDGKIFYMPVLGGDIASGDSITITSSTGDEATCTANADSEVTWGDETDTSGITYYTTTPVTVKAGNMEIGTTGAKPRLNSFSLDAGNTVTVSQDYNEDEGLAPAQITRRQPSGSIDPEYTATASWDSVSDWLSGISRSLVVSLTRPGAENEGNNITIIIPNAQIQSDTDGNRDEFTIDQIDFSCKSTPNTFDDEFKIVFH